jgi:hypothetical protein
MTARIWTSGVVTEDCMSCHNAYPVLVPHSPKASIASDAIGHAHEAIAARDVDLARRAIVNPRKFDRDQLETRMQCHLELTSSPLPFQVRQALRSAVVTHPGKTARRLFHLLRSAKGAGHDDKFEIAGAAHRPRQSACFQRSHR